VADDIFVYTRDADAPEPERIDDNKDEKKQEKPAAAKSEQQLLKEIDVSERVVLEAKGPQPWKTLIWGLPSPTSALLSAATYMINLLLVVMVVDAVYRGPRLYPSSDLSFARVGFVSDTTAKILVREPRPSQQPIWVSYRDADTLVTTDGVYAEPTTAWKSAGSIEEPLFNEESDFTASTTLTRLHPDTRYQYTLSNNHTGYFFTAPVVGKTSKRHDGRFTFLHSSCIKSRFPYNPLDHPLHISGFKYLADWIPKLKAHFMVFLGDFIYIDVPRRHGIGREAYRSEYRRVYASPDWPSVSDDLPWIHVLDDHEIANDWDKNTTGIYQAAADPWDLYHVSVNPPSGKEGHTWFTFTQGPAAFFLMDTRRYRTPETDDPNEVDKSMLGPEQLLDLIKFLQDPLPSGVHWKVIISSVPFTKNWHFGGKDTWGGYLVERQVILENMWSAGARGVGVIVLSGDRHEFAATAFPPPPGSKFPASATVYEFSTSPLSMFYLPIRTYKQTDGEDVTIK
jgi:alkaline phosphatase D